MSAAVLPAPALPVTTQPPTAVAPGPVVPSAWPRSSRWTCELLNGVCDTGLLEGRNVFLVNGELLEMPPPGPAHSTATTLVDYTLRAIFPKTGFVFRIQDGSPLGLATDPVPDLAVVAGSIRDFTVRHPRTAVLVVEVADSSLAYDRGEKAHLYAAAGVADYWVLDLANGRLEVFRDPRPDPAAPFGAGYTRVTTHGPGESVAPLAVPTATVAVADLLP